MFIYTSDFSYININHILYITLETIYITLDTKIGCFSLSKEYLNTRNKEDLLEIEGWYLEIARNGKFWYFSSFLSTQIILFTFILCWKYYERQNSKQLSIRVEKLCREWVSVWIVFLSSLIMPPKVSIREQRRGIFIEDYFHWHYPGWLEIRPG